MNKCKRDYEISHRDLVYSEKKDYHGKTFNQIEKIYIECEWKVLISESDFRNAYAKYYELGGRD